MRVGIVNRFSGSMYRIGEALAERGHDWVPLDYRQLKLVDGHVLHQGHDVADLPLDGILWRISESDYPASLPLLEALNQIAPLINPLDSIKVAASKWSTYERMVEAGLPAVPTALILKAQAFTRSVKLPTFLPGDFDPDTFVLKPVFGANGLGVRLVLRDLFLDGASVLQPYAIAESSLHYRVQVTGGEVTGTVHRIPLWEDSVTNNLENGGISRPASLTDELRELALAASAAVGTTIAGIDIIPSPDGQRLYVLEVNSTPGIQGMYDTGQPAEPGIAKAIEDYLLQCP